MRKFNVVIVDDQPELSEALKATLESQTDLDCKVHVLNPCREKPPTFEEFTDEIVRAVGVWGIVLMDHQLGTWRWTGAHLAPSFCNVISISTEDRPWAKDCFKKKTSIAFHNNAEAKEELVETVRRVASKMVPSDL